MNDTIENLYALIANEASAAAPAGWLSLRMEAKIEEDNGQVIYDYEDSTGIESWFEPATLVQYKIYQSFQTIWSLMTKTGSTWNTATFTLSNVGTFKVNFEYE